MRKFLSILLAIAMITALFTMGSPVSAEESYRVIFQNEQTTDIDQLLQMYEWSQRATQRPVTENTTFTEVSNNDDKLIVMQTLECREYSNGRKEYDTVATELIAYDDGVLLSATATTAESFAQAFSHSSVNAVVYYNLTHYWDGATYAKLTNITANLLTKGASDTVNVQLIFNIADGFGSNGQWGRSRTFNKISVGTPVTFANTVAPYVPVSNYATVFAVGAYFGINATATTSCPSISMDRSDIYNSICHYYP